MRQMFSPSRRDKPGTTYSPALIIGAMIMGGWAGLALVSLVWTPFEVTILNPGGRFSAPSWTHWLGTDHYGRDVLSMLMKGGVVALVLACASVAAAMVAAVPLATAAVYRGGFAETIIARLVEILVALPVLVIAILVTAQSGPGLVPIFVATVIFNSAIFLQVTHTWARRVVVYDYVRAARALGCNPAEIVFRHMIPAMGHGLAAQAAVQFAVTILADAAFHYLRLGLPPPHPTWGRMLLDAQGYLFVAPTQVIAPATALALIVLGAGLFSDGLKAYRDPVSRTF